MKFSSHLETAKTDYSFPQETLQKLQYELNLQVLRFARKYQRSKKRENNSINKEDKNLTLLQFLCSLFIAESEI